MICLGDGAEKEHLDTGRDAGYDDVSCVADRLGSESCNDGIIRLLMQQL